MRILITSDLHLEYTGVETIRRLVAGISRDEPDLVILAGDLGNPEHLFEQCLATFLPLSCPVAVLSGNHDIWAYPGATSISLYEEVLPAITRSLGYHWLERDPMVIPGGIGIAGNIGWYDYSFQEPKYQSTLEEVIRRKADYAMDALKVDWEYSDLEFADLCRQRLIDQITKLEADPSVRRILVVTHVPLMESQVDRRPDDADWSLGNPYFAHLTLGSEVLKFPKVRWVVSGHTHVEMNGIAEREGLEPVATAVIPSDYGRPRWVTLEV